MKILLKILLVFVLGFSFLQNTFSWSFSEIVGWWTPKVHIDCWWVDCNIETWVRIIKDEVNSIETERSFSQYIQDIVAYILTFVSIIAVIYIIYAWIRIMISAWNEETLKKQKMTILYVILWILLIRISYSIVAFILKILNES